MGTSYTPTTISSGFQSTDTLNSELAAIAAALGECVSRMGDSPNQMEEVLDMNDNRIINLGAGVLTSDAANLANVSTIAQNIVDTAINNASGTPTTDFTDSNPLTFNYGISSGSDASAAFTTFDLNTLHAVEDLQGLTVFVNGACQFPGLAYTVTDTTTVVFSESLEANSEVLFIWGDVSPTPVFSNAKVTLTESATTATAGQTVFTAPTYQIGLNQLLVSVDGIIQSLTSGDYTETTTTSITLDEAAIGGERVNIRNFTGI